MTGAAYQSKARRSAAGRWLALVLVIAGATFFWAIRDVFGPGFGQTIDGWQVGARDGCPSPNYAITDPTPTSWDCQASLDLWQKTALAGLDARDPTHATIRSITIHHYAGDAIWSGGCCEVAVFELADGSLRAMGIGHAGIDTEHLITVQQAP